MKEVLRVFLLEYFNPKRKLKILDLSCGSGKFLNGLRRKGHKIVGADFSRRPIYNIPYVYFDGRDLPFPFRDKSFDLVTCMLSIGQYIGGVKLTKDGVGKLNDVLSEIFRIARKDVFILNRKNHPNRELTEFIFVEWKCKGWVRDRRSDFRRMKWTYAEHKSK